MPSLTARLGWLSVLIMCTAAGCASSNTPSTPSDVDASTDAAATSDSPAATGTFTAIYAMMFPSTTNGRCNFCHGLPANTTSNGNLAMGTDKATAYAALVAKKSSGKQCAGQTLVVPGQPDASLFYLKFSEDVTCGSRMPLGGNLLNNSQREMVRSWIAAGAKDD